MTAARAAPLPVRARQIDALRGYSVLAVLHSHFWVPWVTGHLGVRLFFVISGFLITAILLRERDALATGDGPRQILIAFFARRVLRIVPPLFLVLLVAAAAGLEGLRSALGWHLALLSNVLFFVEDSYRPWATAHLWSVSVEEQFYLLWPLAMLFLPRRIQPWICGAMIVTAIVTRVILLATVTGYVRPLVATPAHFDALGAGALWALAVHRGFASRWLRPLQIVGLAAAVVALAVYLMLSGFVTEYLIAETLSVVPMVAMVATAATMPGTTAWRIVANPPIVKLGEISYGVYLFHYFVLAGFWALAARLGLPVLPLGPLTFAACGTITIALASLSWRYYEAPINALKTRVPYGRRSMPSGPGI